MDPKLRTRVPDRRIPTLAARQHGVISLRQLLEIGLSETQVRDRVAARRLHRLHRGIYAIAPSRLLRIQGHWLAGVMAIGPDAVLSHRCAAAHHNLLSYGGSRVEVTVPRRLRPRRGLCLYCRGSLPAHHATTKDAIPVTSVGRTIADLAAISPPRLLERAIGQAEAERSFDLAALEEVLASEPGRPGSRSLRRLLGRIHDPASLLTRSSYEESLLTLSREAGAEDPELNVPFTLPDGTEIVIDALWRKQRLALEVDSEAFHSSWSAQVSDRHRDRQLTLAGFRPARVSEDDFASGAAIEATRKLLLGLLAPGSRTAG